MKDDDKITLEKALIVAMIECKKFERIFLTLHSAMAHLGIETFPVGNYERAANQALLDDALLDDPGESPGEILVVPGARKRKPAPSEAPSGENARVEIEKLRAGAAAETPRKRNMSAAGRRAISQASKRRWRLQKAAAKK